MLGLSDDAALQRHLAAAPVIEEGWTRFLEALRQRSGAAQVALSLVLRGSEWRFQTGPVVLPEPALPLRSERVYAQDEFDQPGTPLRLLYLAQRGGLQARLAISHPFNDFRATDGALLARLAPHLDQALSNWLLLSRERAQTADATKSARALGAYWLWLDPAGRIVEADPDLSIVIGESEDLRLTAGRIEPQDPLRARMLRRALDDALAGIALPDVALAADLRLHLQPGLVSTAPGLEPVLRGVVRQAPLARRRDPDMLAKQLGTSRSEARLAALICDGFSLAEAAEELGWTLETTRSASKRLYQQTGTSGQTGLLRRLQTGAHWFLEP